jgi:anti-sigma regulatory factor (Ser/Thr protein kinase)
MSVQLQQAPHHGVDFYASDQALVETTARYLAAGMQRGDVAIVIATPDHLPAFVAGVEALGVDVAGAREAGTWIGLDAKESLVQLLVDGRPDEAAFDRVVGTLVRRAASRGRRAVAFGEMVALLWAAGNVNEALELEELWNGCLARELFSLRCAYPSSTVDDDPAAVREVCGLHSHVEGLTEPEREISLRLPLSVESPARARSFLSEALTRWGYESIRDEAVIVVSELATNAVIHARREASLTVSARPGAVRVAVADGDSVLPVKGEPSVFAPSGRGLIIVERLSSEWGAQTTETGKSVWAEWRNV